MYVRNFPVLLIRDRVISELSSRGVMADCDGHSSPLPVTLQCILNSQLLSSWATVCKTVRPMLYRTVVLSVLQSVCDVGVLWPNGWMDQDET